MLCLGDNLSAMSGIEIAGLVLGAFPLAISALEHGRTVAIAGRLHRRIRGERREYTKCRSDIMYHQIVYKSNLRTLLLGQDPDVVQGLIEDPGGPRWHDDSSTQKLLEERLQEKYAVYMDIMERMKETITQLKKELCVDDVTIQSHLQVVTAKSTTIVTTSTGLMSTTTASTFSSFATIKSRWDYETFRIKFSLGAASREELFGELQDCNTRLKTLLSCVIEAPAPTTLPHPLESIFKATRKKSALLYQALKEAWKCPCQHHHSGNLRLEHYTASHVHFEVILSSRASISSNTSQSSATCPTTSETGTEAGWEWARLQCKQLTTCPCSEHVGGACLQSPPLTPNGSSSTLSNPSKPVLSLGTRTFGLSPPPVTRPTMRTAGVTFPPSPASSVMSRKTVSIQPHIPRGATDRSGLEDPLCQVLAGKRDTRHDCLGMIGSEDETYHLHPLPDMISKSFTTLGDMLSQQSGLTSRRQRYLVALLLAASVVQHGHTQWLRGGMTKDKILFFPDDQDKSVLNEAFIQQDFTTRVVDSSASDNFLELLGITLIELCFGQRLEDTQARKKYPTGSEDDGTKLALDLLAASAWRKQVEEEGGPDYAAAVKWCFSGSSFQGSWHKDLVRNVIVPLEKCQQQFHRVTAH